NSNLTITSYNWVFGDGSPSSNLANPSHTYEEGTFNVSLAIETNIANCNTTGIVDTVQVLNAPAVSFTTDPNPPTSCSGPFTVAFNNTTIDEEGLSYLWIFGNGDTLTVSDPGPQTYEEDGLYNVSLTVTNSINCSNTFTSTINVGNPVIDVNAPDTVCVGELFSFQNNSASGAYAWDFGPNASPQTANSAEPNVTFLSGGDQTVSLTLTGVGGCTSTSTFTIFADEVDATFTSDPTFSCSEPLTINFTPVFTGEATFEWLFQDDSTSMEMNPTHDYFNDDTTIHSINGLLEYETTLTVTTPSGCSATFSRIDTLHQPNALFMPDTISGCAPLSVIFSDSSSSFSNIVSWEYDFGDGTVESFTNDDDVTHVFTNPGEYDVVLNIENANGCVDTSYTVTIEVGDVITPDFMVDQTTVCPGDTVHFTDLTQSNDIDAWHFDTEGGRSFHCFDQNELFYAFDNVTGPQDVTLTVEYNGCFSSLTQEDLIQVNGPIALIDYEIDCETPFNVAFRDSSMDATMVTWEFGDSTMSTVNDIVHVYDTTGDYTVFLTAENPNTGCPASVDSLTVFIRDIEAGMTVDSFICIGDMVDLDASLSTDVEASCWKGFDWHFSPGLGRPITTQDTIVDKVFNTPGDHTVFLVTTDINGCRDTTEQDVWVFSGMPDFTFSDDPVCLPVSIDFMDMSTADTTIVMWEWDFGDMAMSTDTNPSHSYSKPPNSISSIPVTLTITDATGCPFPITKNLQVYEPFSVITADPGTDVCVDTEISFMASDFTQQGSSLTWEWNFGPGNMSTNQNETFLYDIPGSFDVILNIQEIATGCQNSDTITVNVQAYPEANFTTSVDGIDPLCAPVNIDFIDDSDYFGAPRNLPVWNLDNGIVADGNPVSSSFDRGTYDVELFVETSFGCRDSIIRSFDVIGPEGDFTMSATEICRGESITFTLIDPIDVSSFTWDFGDGVTMDGGTTVTHQYNTIPPGSSTTVTLLLRGENDVCEFTVEKEVSIRAVIADFAQDNACFDLDGYTFNNTSNLADLFTWDLGNGATSNEPNPTVVYDPGTYDVQLIVENAAFGCVDTIRQPIEIFALPVVMADAEETACEDADLALAVIDPDAGSSYSWTPTDFITAGANAPNATANLPAGLATFTVTETDANGCQGTDEIEIDILSAPIVSAEDLMVCVGTPATLSIDQVAGITYTWLNESGAEVGTGTTVTTGNISSNTTFTVVGANEAACEGFDQVSVEVIDGAMPTVLTVDTTVCTGTLLTLPVTKTDDVVFEWSDTTGLSCTDCSLPMLVVEDMRIITLTERPLDINTGCNATITTFEIDVFDGPEMPNAFTPDSDESNDFFNYAVVDENSVNRVDVFRIYNRFGNVVYDNGNPMRGWDGFHKGKLAPSDVYLYTIELTLNGGCPYSEQGEVTLIR
ncbi:MAG: PKD domain-containing protein, partial [Bacteroidota bacterium]